MKDLLKLYTFYSVHGTDAEKHICDWIVERLKELGIEDINRDGNTIWRFSKGNQTLISAHLDQVATNGPAVHFYKSDKGIIKAYNCNWQRTSLGADDKNGIWCILKLLESGYDFDFIISEGEEVGCVGINKIEKHIKDSDAGIAIVLDRKSNTDILKGGSIDTYCDTLAGQLRNYLNSYGDNNYTVTTGSISDTRVICKYIESVNMCVNYEGAHTKNEVTDWNALQKTVENLERVLDLFQDYYYPTDPKEYIKQEYSYTRSSFEDDRDLLDYYGGYYGKKYRR